jgi:copper chaperone CopZ
MITRHAINNSKINKMKSKFFITLSFALAFTLTASVSAFAQTTKDQTESTSQKLQTIKLKVSGVTCSGDCKDIQKEVGKLNGVTSITQIGKPSATSVFEVIFNPTVVSEKELRKAVEDTPGCKDPNDRPYKVKQG